MTGVGNLQRVLLFCSDTQLPGINVSTTQVRSFGEFREAPYEKLYDNITMTYYVDQAMEVKTLFDSWTLLIQGKNRKFEYYDNYVTDIQIYVEDARDDSRYAVCLYECYPKSISPISIGYENKDVMKMQVSMNYKWWESYPLPPNPAREPGPWDFLNKFPTINNRPAQEFLTDFGGFQSKFNNTFPESQGVTTGVTTIFSGR
jgi:hypothetical protein